MFDLMNNIQILRLVTFTVTIRLVCLFVVQSYFVPDEYWQSLEIAHKTVFGYGYITWEWDKAIRSFFYPSLISVLYKLLEILKLDYVEILIFTPKLFQMILSTVADFFYWEWLNLVLARKCKEKVFCVYLMWMMCLMVNYCSTRTLTNTAECNFTIIALYYFECKRSNKSNKLHFLWFVGVACLIRPTSFIHWIPICLFDILSNSAPLKYCLTVYTSIVAKILCVSVCVDYLFYKRIVLTPLNFLLYNGQYNFGNHYGVHSSFWYIIVGITIVLGPVSIIFYCSVYRIFKHLLNLNYEVIAYQKRVCLKTICSTEVLMLITIIWSLSWYSLVPHKEFRFILPLVPLMIFLAGTEVDINELQINQINKYLFVFITINAMICNVLGIFYLGQWHQIGPINVASKLSQIAKENPKSDFLFLTPCHATPLYSHLHVNVTTRFITCAPNTNFVENYEDESDIFFKSPPKWLRGYFDKKSTCTLPSHIILFDSLLTLSIQNLLNDYNYTKYDVIFNTHIVQGRQSKHFVIFSLNNTHSCYNSTSHL